MYLDFTLNEDINLDEDYFSISCIQQGDRITSFKLKEGDDTTFNLSEFGIVLIKREQLLSDCKLIKAKSGGTIDWHFSLGLKKGKLLKGDYSIVLYTYWNKSIKYFPQSKHVNV